MRILLVAPSIEPGKSGVGDYALSLAGELSRLGQTVALIGLADETDQIKRTSPSETIRSLALPQTLPWPERQQACRDFCRDFQPDWISLQFVCYAFDPRGLVWNLGSRLRSWGGGASWHVMFHEIWVGAKMDASWKQRLLGRLQRASIQWSIRALKPRAVHTSNETYRSLLARAGIPAGIQPMFGSIPFLPPSDDSALETLLARHGPVPGGTAPRLQELWIGLFGSLHPIWPPEPFFTHLLQAEQISGRRPVLISVGRLGPGRELWERLRKDYGTRITFLELGEQSPERICRLFQRLDCGIATTPYQVIGKSSSAAAMVEHGLPVIVNRTERYGLPSDDLPHPEPLYLPMTADLPRLLAALPPRRAPRSLLPETARGFLNALEETSAAPSHGL